MKNLVLESILKTSNAGIRHTVENYISELLQSQNNGCLNRNDFKINDDFSISCDGDLDVQKTSETSVYIKKARILNVWNSDIKEFIVPIQCKFLRLIDLNKLKKIVFKKGTKIDEVLIENCGNGDISIEFEDKNDIQISRFNIKHTTITSITDFPNISERLFFYKCVIVNNINLEQNSIIPIVFEKCVIKKFTGIFSAEYLKFTDCKINDIDIKFEKITYFWFFNIKALKHIKIIKNNNSSELIGITVDNCKQLETITCKGVKRQLSFTNLPNILRFDLETNNNNIVFIQHCAVVPEVDCKLIVK